MAHVEHSWHWLTRIAFRFCFVYFGLFCLTFAQIVFVYTGVAARWLPPESVIWQMTILEPVLTWAGQHVFGIEAVLHRDSNSGDQAVIWVMVFVLFVVAALATLAWSVIDRRRVEYHRLHAWFLLFVRLCLGGQMLFYGFAKLIPTQMPAPPLTALLQPFGDLSRTSVLWLQVGSSPVYQMALGAVEVIGGLLLFWGRTATLGALVSVVAMAQVFLLNMTYDVPVKILSFHLLLLSLFLIAPQIGRLANVLVLQRPSDPMIQPALFDSARANRIATTVVALAGVWVLAGCVAQSWSAWHDYGGGRAKPELYGIWSVTEYSADGEALPPLTSDGQRWQRVIFDEPGVIVYQLMDGELVIEPVESDGGGSTLRIPGQQATLAVDRPAPDRLRLQGELGGQRVSISLERTDLDSFTLRGKGFHWVQDYPNFT